MPVPAFVKRVLLDEAQIKYHVRQLAAKINRFYCGRTRFVVCIGVLTGCTMFMMELLKQVDFYCQVFFVKVESYAGANRVKQPVLTHNLIPRDARLNGTDVLIIDDIVDSSLTAQFLKNFIQTNFKPRSVKIAVLLAKQGLEKAAQAVDWVATTVPNVFVAGYNFDYFGLLRFFPYIFEPDLPQLKRFVAALGRG